MPAREAVSQLPIRHLRQYVKFVISGNVAIKESLTDRFLYGTHIFCESEDQKTWVVQTLSAPLTVNLNATIGVMLLDDALTRLPFLVNRSRY